jgi:hypothetical protein
MEILDKGLFKRISIPDGWVLLDMRDEARMGIFYLSEFQPPDDPDVRLSFFYRGRPEGRMASENFKNLLSKPPHELAEQELLPVMTIMRNLSDPREFKALSVRTEDLNGKRVLVADGIWDQPPLKTKHMFIDAEADGGVVQEMYYRAPEDLYDQYLRLAVDSFNSIEWKW